MLDTRAALVYYSQKWVQEAICSEAQDREVGVKISTGGFGKRPEVLKYPSDVLEFARQGITSFHFSEERWRNPLHLTSDMNKKAQDALRSGWDLVLDIDCPHWELSKSLAFVIAKSLQEHGISNVGVKFSGNKGWHIGVPFESFPATIGGIPAEQWFPEGPRRIAEYLMEYITRKHVTIRSDALHFRDAGTFRVTEIQKALGDKSISEKRCARCKKPWGKKDISHEFICPKCEHREQGDEQYRKCARCGSFMERSVLNACSCGSSSSEEVFDPKSVIEVDTILIASRHLYRSCYSLHEKSGLASIPIEPAAILAFDKQSAQPSQIHYPTMRFLDRTKSTPGEAITLFREAFDYRPKIEEEAPSDKENRWEESAEAIPEQFFPPCVQHILRGISDGKKRALFIMVNFLTMAGWDYDMIEKRLREWNAAQAEPVREQVLVSHIRYHKQQGKKMLPPNCDNQMYYVGIGVCHPDELCRKIKNPVNYAKLKARMAAEGQKKGRKKKIPNNTL